MGDDSYNHLLTYTVTILEKVDSCRGIDIYRVSIPGGFTYLYVPVRDGCVLDIYGGGKYPIFNDCAEVPSGVWTASLPWTLKQNIEGLEMSEDWVTNI